MACREKSKAASKMKPWQGYAHGVFVALSVWLFRETIFEALQWWNGRPPSDGLLLGSCILLSGLACVPIVALHFSRAMSAKRSLVLVVATGLLFILMQPPIPLSWTYHFDFIKSARQSAYDISIYGFMALKPTWPSLLLIRAILLTLAAVTSVTPTKYVVELRAFYLVAVGIALGVYISAEYFLQAAVLLVLITVTMVCTCVFIVFMHIPSASSTEILPWVFAVIEALFPVTYIVEGQLRINQGSNTISGASTSFLGLYAAIFMLIALEIKFKMASLMRENSTEENWMPAVGNVSTVLCFGICLILNDHLAGGSNCAILFLAPILLLLNQDSDIFAGFGDKQRYFPVTLTISANFVVTALCNILDGNAGWGVDNGRQDWIFAVKNLALLVVTSPSHIILNRYVWSYTKQADSTVLVWILVSLPCVIITDLIKIKILGLVGVIYSLGQYLISRQQYISFSGLRYIQAERSSEYYIHYL